MDLQPLHQRLTTAFPTLKAYLNHPLAPYTTVNIGGPADLFIQTISNDELIKILNFINGRSKQFFSPQRKIQSSQDPEGSEDCKNSFASPNITVLGNGSNVLISDSGIRGIVIKNSSQSIEIINTSPIPIEFHHTYTQRNENEPEKYLDFTKLDYDESQKPQVLVKISSGTSLPYTINYLLDHGITGLQWFAYIPGTIGGATWYNIHGGAYHFADYIDSIDTYDLETGNFKTFQKNQTDWSYEHSYFQQHPNLIILSTTLRLFRGDAALAKSVKDAWIAQKAKVQSMNSPGSCFANPGLVDCQKIWGEQKSTGWIIDHELGLKGHAIGEAQVSEKHANFIVNNGSATAADYLSLIRLIQQRAQEKLGLSLETEIKLLGL